MNTPYLINSIIKGNENEKNGVLNPHTSLGYLILNGLPFSTLHEYIKTYDGSTTNNEGYLFASLTKFSAIHKIPYLWILKYGSIWYRYKKKIQDNVDVLDEVWNDVNYLDLYDPISQNANKNYIIDTLSQNDYVYYLNRTNQSAQSDIENISLNVGFYPKLINEMYYLFTKKDVITSYPNNIKNVLNDIGVKVDNLNNSSKYFSNEQNTITNNQSINLQNWFQYININGNIDFENNQDKVLIIPSCGFMNYNQSVLELSDNLGNLTKPLISNSSFYNGSVRGLWGGANFGYFDHTNLQKPDSDQYLKFNETSFGFTNDKTKYDSIEDIFSCFSLEQLNEFENTF